MAKIPMHLDVRSLAREHTGFAIQRLAKLARYAESEPVQMSACIALLDRGWGKPMTTLSDEIAGDIRIVVRHIVTGERPIKTVEQLDTPALPLNSDGADK
jgi:hypothetical protein